MSFSRWLDSVWYVYPTVKGRIDCWHAGDMGVPLQWTQEKTLSQFLDHVKEQLPNVSEEDIQELEDILKANFEEIMGIFLEYNKERENET
jgi:hypothetical protein